MRRSVLRGENESHLPQCAFVPFESLGQHEREWMYQYDFDDFFGLVDEYFRQVEFLFCDMDIIEVGGQHCLLALRHVKFGQRVRIVFYRIVSQIS